MEQKAEDQYTVIRLVSCETQTLWHLLCVRMFTAVKLVCSLYNRPVQFSLSYTRLSLHTLYTFSISISQCFQNHFSTIRDCLHGCKIAGVSMLETFHGNEWEYMGLKQIADTVGKHCVLIS